MLGRIVSATLASMMWERELARGTADPSRVPRGSFARLSLSHKGSYEAAPLGSDISIKTPEEQIGNTQAVTSLIELLGLSKAVSQTSGNQGKGRSEG